MNMLERMLCMISLVLIVTDMKAQDEDSFQGIHWINNLSWEQVKQKARNENKYIFLDAFATWCGPCKMMDKNVYTNSKVGNYFNEIFISVRVQMDQTEKDNEFVKSWYNDASMLAKLYRVEAFPTFIFLSPQGNVVHKEMGYQGIDQFIDIAQTATRPGKIYDDKYAEYDQLVKEYKGGKRNYGKMPYMINTAYKFGYMDFGKQLLEEHTEYVKNLKPMDRYTKENIQMWSGFLLNSSSPRFLFFYKDGRVIDKVMNQRGYAQSVVDKTIQHEIVDSFFKMQEGEATLTTGKKVRNNEIMALGSLPIRVDGKIEADTSEADWEKLGRMIKQKFGKSCAKRNVLIAKIAWYNRHNNYVAATKYTLERLENYPPDLVSEKDYINAYGINEFAWNVFRYVPSSEKVLQIGALKWAEKAFPQIPNYTPLIDTYANLLYKMRRTEEAIKWEEKAIEIAEAQNKARIAKGLSALPQGFSPDTYKHIVDQMRKGEQTYTNEGAMWN